jgi:hypothetical protein
MSTLTHDHRRLASAAPKRLEPYAIAVPDAIAREIDRMVEEAVRHTQRPTDLVRRDIVIKVLALGVEGAKTEGVR